MVLFLGMSRGWLGTPTFDASCSLIYINLINLSVLLNRYLWDRVFGNEWTEVI